MFSSRNSLHALAWLVLSAPTVSLACEQCAPTVEALVYGSDFTLNLLRMLAPIAVIFAIACVVHHVSKS